MKLIKHGGVTSPRGFKANGLSAGIKRSGKTDLSLIYCDQSVPTVGVFTKNSIKAAPLLVTQEHLRNHSAQAIVANSGNANCFTGDFGLIYARQTAELAGALLGAEASEVLVSSTGIIGKPLPFLKIKKALPALVKGASVSGGHRAALGIMTTDLVAKEVAVSIQLSSGDKVTIGACAKGSGMIEPNMATMLGFITTDAAVSASMLQKLLKRAVEYSFNRITVDGCMSTNDMVTLMANGLAKNTMITRPGKDYNKFYEALHYVCLDLAKKIVMDGEGATKFLEITVNGAKTEKEAKDIAMKVANSNLVKTAAYGSNPNWGRVAGAVGTLGLDITEKTLKIKFTSFKKKNIQIFIDLNRGRQSATVYTSDLSIDYVKINGKYS
ncbi:MAG: bifunctional glutamate N-acetyltransferase/amino-acid acetyltransferase ArgJ [Candidatus Omnitrophica bacterium]|nr:bifunctional glutamate N-acetyltransferase/amino-acid acetyltransferase ArgJ [Candidatus Omnitrophota bacterium]